MEKTLEIIFGDDMFLDSFTSRIFESDYAPMLQDKVKDYKICWKLVTKHDELIKEAKTGLYDVVVTDLDYAGGGSGKEGYAVIDEVSMLSPKPLLILCTSSDNFQEIARMTQGKIDYHAGGKGKGHKFDELVEVLAAHYSK
jgi:hypothetical protein